MWLFLQVPANLLLTTPVITTLVRVLSSLAWTGKAASTLVSLPPPLHSYHLFSTWDLSDSLGSKWDHAVPLLKTLQRLPISLRVLTVACKALPHLDASPGSSMISLAFTLDSIIPGVLAPLECRLSPLECFRAFDWLPLCLGIESAATPLLRSLLGFHLHQLGLLRLLFNVSSSPFSVPSPCLILCLRTDRFLTW